VQFVVEDCENDYELVIRLSKEIESVLERDYGANGASVAKAGLGAKIKVATAPEPSDVLWTNLDFPSSLAHGMQVSGSSYTIII